MLHCASCQAEDKCRHFKWLFLQCPFVTVLVQHLVFVCRNVCHSCANECVHIDTARLDASLVKAVFECTSTLSDYGTCREDTDVLYTRPEWTRAIQGFSGDNNEVIEEFGFNMSVSTPDALKGYSGAYIPWNYQANSVAQTTIQVLPLVKKWNVGRYCYCAIGALRCSLDCHQEKQKYCHELKRLCGLGNSCRCRVIDLSGLDDADPSRSAASQLRILRRSAE